MRAQAVGAGGPCGVGLLVLSLGYTLGHLLGQWSLAWGRDGLAVCCLEARALVVYYQRWFVSARTMGGPTAHSPDAFGEDCPEEASTDGCERFVFLENIEGIAGSWRRGAPPEAAGWSWRGGDNDGLS
jgi:hypothetical protein